MEDSSWDSWTILQKKGFALFAQQCDPCSLFFILPTELICEIFSYISNPRKLIPSNPFKCSWIWGQHGSGNGNFYHPHGITWDSLKKRIFITDYNHSVQCFSENGNFLFRFGKLGENEGEFNIPTGIAYSPHNQTLYVCDQHNYRVQLFDSFGIYLSQIPIIDPETNEVVLPWYVSVSFSGTVFVSVGGPATAEGDGNHKILVYSPNGKFLFSFGTLGESVGEFNCPRGIAVSRHCSRVYVCDMNNHRIQVFSLKGRFLFSFGSNGKAGNPFVVTLDEQDNLYVVDSIYHQIQVFNPDGRSLMSFGTRGCLEGQMNCPWSAIVTEEGLVYVCDTLNNRIQVFK